MRGFFGWLWRRRWGATAVVPPPAAVIPPSPTQLRLSIVNTELAVVEYQPTQLVLVSFATILSVYSDDGFLMSTPTIFTAGETGPLTLKCTGVDGSVENLATALSVTLTVQNVNGTIVVNAVALTSPAADGTAVWTRTALQTATPGDYTFQVKVVRSDSTIGYFPDGQNGNALTMLKAVGS